MKLKRDLNRLDFVTSRPIDECRAVLERETARFAPDWQRIFLHDDNTIFVERLVTLPAFMSTSAKPNVEVRFEGTLEPIAAGTRVRGSVTPDFYETYHRERLFAIGVTAVTAVISSIAALSGGWVGGLLLMTITAAVWGLVIWRWREARWYPVQLMNWIREHLAPSPTEY